MDNSLDCLRKELDGIDEKIIALFCERMEISEKIGAFKAEKGIPVCDPKREDEILERITSSVPADKAEYVRELYRAVFVQSKKAQKKSPAFRKGTRDDIPGIKTMFSKIVLQMIGSGLNIWDDIYPNSAVEEDIENGYLYVMEADGNITAAFSLLPSFDDDAVNTVKWPCEEKDVMYMFRLGVDPSSKRKGYASAAIDFCRQVCRENGKKLIALYAAEKNIPARSFYEKNGFTRMDGERTEVITEDFSLTEYGYCLRV